MESQISAILYFIIGLGILIRGADWLVDKTSLIARHYNISPLIIGIVLVSFGTSVPELAVSIIISIEKNSADLIIGNVLGSNIANILLVLGVAAILAKIDVSKEILKKHLTSNGLALGFFTLCYSLITPYQITRIEAVFLLLTLSTYLYYLYYTGKQNTTKPKQANSPSSPVFSLLRTSLWLIVSISLIGLGGELISRNVVTIAVEIFGGNEIFAGVVLLALGTSLPELVTSIIAFRKGENDLLLGNVLGSNIFNILCIVGVSALIHPLSDLGNYSRELAIHGMSLGAVLLFSLTGRTYQLSRRNGMILFLLYILYLQAFLNANLAA